MLEKSTVTVTNCIHFTLWQFPVPNVANGVYAGERFKGIGRK